MNKLAILISISNDNLFFVKFYYCNQFNIAANLFEFFEVENVTFYSLYLQNIEMSIFVMFFNSLKL